MFFSQTDDLNWTVSKHPVVATYGDVTVEIPNKFAIVRDDNQTPLGIVGTKYEPVQNSSLLKLIESQEAEGLLTRDNTGILQGGSKVFIQTKFAEEFSVAGDNTQATVTLLNSHDGSTSTRIGITATRIICMNTFAMAMGDLDVRITHAAGANERVLTHDFVRDYVNTRMGVYAKQMEEMAGTSCSKGKFETLVKQTFKKEDLTKWKQYNDLEYLFRNGAGNSGLTVADFVNAVTEFNTHRSSKKQERRFVSNQFGYAATTSQRAWNAALATV